MSFTNSVEKELAIVSSEQSPSMEIDKVMGEVESVKENRESSQNQDKVTEITRNISKMVKHFRLKALLLEAEQESLLSMLMSLRDVQSVNIGTPEGIVTDWIDNLTSTLTNVDVKISTDRTKNEEEALHEVNSIINQLVTKVQDDLNATKETCESFLKCCYQTTSEADVVAAQDSVSAVVATFESFIAKCSEDDQQRVGRRLRGLLNYIKSLQNELHHCALEQL